MTTQIKHNKQAKKRNKIYAKGKGICYICFKQITPLEMSMDHFKPVFLGGKANITNLMCCCEPCNQKKGIIEWYLSRDWPLGSNLLDKMVKAYSYYNRIVSSNHKRSKLTRYHPSYYYLEKVV